MKALALSREYYYDDNNKNDYIKEIANWILNS